MRAIYDDRPTGIRAYIGKLILIGPNVKSLPSYSPYPRRDGQAKLTWVAGYIIKMVSGRLRHGEAAPPAQLLHVARGQRGGGQRNE